MFGFGVEKNAEFQAVAQAGSYENLLADSERTSTELRRPAVSPQGVSRSTVALIAICTAILSAFFGVMVAQHSQLDADTFSIRHTSQYSPIVKDVDIVYQPVKFQGSLLKTNVFRGDAGPEVDEAWKSLGTDFNAVRVPAEEAEKSGLAQDQVKIKEKYGGGFPANVEGLHHLHCLNLLRKSLPWNIEYYKKQGHGAFSNSEYILKHHVTHCLDIIRQQLMCNIDVGVLGQVWYQPPGKATQAFVDFNTVHKCRNFDAVRDWAEKHQLPDAADTPADFLEPPKDGDKIWHELP